MSGLNQQFTKLSILHWIREFESRSLRSSSNGPSTGPFEWKVVHNLTCMGVMGLYSEIGGRSHATRPTKKRIKNNATLLRTIVTRWSGTLRFRGRDGHTWTTEGFRLLHQGDTGVTEPLST